MTRFAKGRYICKNPEKYIGGHEPIYRSSWESAAMSFFDQNSHILKWASEPFQIPYKHPFKGRTAMYIPDFFVLYEDKYGRTKAEVVEIKPKKQSILENKSSARDKVIVAINRAKWAAAQVYCSAHGYTFRIITEQDLFHQGKA